jgi:hypothetical protein
VSDEHESAFAAWYNSPETQREIAVIRRTFPHGEWDCALTDYQVVQLALQMEILVALDVYEIPDIDPPEPPPDEPWRRAA